MIEKLQQLVAEASGLLQAYQSLEAERMRLVNEAHASDDVAVVSAVAVRLNDLAPQFGKLMDQASALELSAEEAYSAAQEMIDNLREQSVDVANDVYSECDSSADACTDDASDLEDWVEEQEEAAPEQLSRRYRRPLFRVG